MFKFKLGVRHDMNLERESLQSVGSKKKCMSRSTETGINQHFLNMHLTCDLLAVALTKSRGFKYAVYRCNFLLF